jgi:hypothetical protein
VNDELSPPPLLVHFMKYIMRSIHIQFRHSIDTHPSNCGTIIISSSLKMGSKGYPETSHLFYDIRPCHQAKVLEHKFHLGKSPGSRF